MENVVYILGAGFSQPLGLPTISNFFDKAYELFFSGDEKYKYFYDVLETIKKMSYIKNYYSSDLFNIEEALSIYEMSRQTNTKIENVRIEDFIIDVIKHYTPSMEKINYSPYAGGNATDIDRQKYYQKNQLMQAYTLFVHALLGLQTYSLRDPDLRFQGNISLHEVRSDIQTNYTVITLNYDNVLERIATILNSSKTSNSKKIEFKKFPINETTVNNNIPLCKLHGCIDNGKIIPPTWNKSINDNVKADWEQAYQSLSQAHHLRIIGFSLPETDSYFKYLLKASVLNADHLKSLDVICLDPDSSTRQRFQNFITYSRMRFANVNTMSYLGRLIYNVSSAENTIREVRLEQMHRSFMESF